MNEKTIVVLAKSYKPGGWCIAGKEVTKIENNQVTLGHWIRPVSNNDLNHNAITSDICRYSDGSEVKVLDIVTIPISSHSPVVGQPENYTVDDSKIWKKISILSAKSISSLVDSCEDIWLEDGGETDKVSSIYEMAVGISQSLYLIKPTELLVTLSNQYNDYTEEFKKKITSSFNYNNQYYENISITDPAIRKALSRQYPNDGEKNIIMALKNGDNYTLCMSLSPQFGDAMKHYKLVATIFDFDGYLQKNYS